MYCHNCGQEVPEGIWFCGSCGAAQSDVPQTRGVSSGPASPTVTLSRRTLLIAAAVVAFVVVVILLVVAIVRLGEDELSGGDRDRSPERDQSQEDPEPEPEPDPAAALVGTWTNKDGIGLKFTKNGTLKLSGMGLSLGADTFTYEVVSEGSMTLTAAVVGVSIDLNASYAILGNTLYIELGGLELELTKK